MREEERKRALRIAVMFGQWVFLMIIYSYMRTSGASETILAITKWILGFQAGFIIYRAFLLSLLAHRNNAEAK